MAVDVFLKLGDIKGESKDSKHAGEIDVLSWSFGVSQTGTRRFGITEIGVPVADTATLTAHLTRNEINNPTGTIKVIGE